MPKRFVGPAIVLAALAFSPVTRAQTAPRAPQTDAPPAKPANGQNENIHVDGWNRPQTSLEASGKKPGPPPVRDLSGIWEPVPGYRDGVFANGPRDMPSDPAHEAMMPYTALGKEMMDTKRAGRIPRPFHQPALLVLADLDVDFPRLGLRFFGNQELQDSVLHFGMDLFWVHTIGK